MPCKYGEFEFPEDRGFSGSAGKTMVKGYARGGKVKKPIKHDCTCHETQMKRGGKVKGKTKGKSRITRADEKLVKQVLDQASRTGRMPGVPVHSREPLIK